MQIRTLERSRLREAAALMAEAFAEEPIIAQMIAPGTPGRARKIADYYVWSIELTGLQTTDVAIDPLTDRIVGVAMWEPPRHRNRWYEGLTAMPGVLRGIGRHGLNVLERFGAASEGKHPAGPHWHLVDIGTGQAARGLGVGTALIEHRLSMIDANREIASLEATTDRSARLYERLGFVHRHTLEGVAAGMSVMWRAAATYSEPGLSTERASAGGAG